MKAIWINLFAASILFSGTALALPGGGPALGTQSDATGLLPGGSNPADASTAEQARLLLSQSANDAATAGKFENLIAHFSRADRKRIGTFQHADMTQLNQTIARFRADFAARYHEDFAITPDMFRDAMVYAGKDDRSARVVLPAVLFSDKLAQAGQAVSDVSFPRQPAKIVDGVSVYLVQEGRGVVAWRIDIPDQTTADGLKANLIKRIAQFDREQATWPSDPDAACRAAAYRIFQAVMDTTAAPEI